MDDHPPGGSVSQTSETQVRKSSVIIADHQRLVADGVARLLESTPDFRVVEVCATDEELKGTLRVLCPDLLLLDIDMPGLPILSFLRSLTRERPAPAVLVVTGLPANIYAAPVVEAGASGFVSKEVSPATLLTAMRSVRDGQLWIQREHAVGSSRERAAAQGVTPDPLSSLSPRELETFHLLGKGMPASEVGQLLFISPRTVASHRLRIYRKLGISSPSALIRLASQFDRMSEPD